jgi:hypothetical protein
MTNQEAQGVSPGRWVIGSSGRHVVRALTPLVTRYSPAVVRAGAPDQARRSHIPTSCPSAARAGHSGLPHGALLGARLVDGLLSPHVSGNVDGGVGSPRHARDGSAARERKDR